jgi:hypothetical protein
MALIEYILTVHEVSVSNEEGSWVYLFIPDNPRINHLDPNEKRYIRPSNLVNNIWNFLNNRGRFNDHGDYFFMEKIFFHVRLLLIFI